MLNELQIKNAVIDRLLQSGALNDAVLINEMVIANWERRVDLAVANGKLHAFEIKSDVDTLRRLDGQLATYSNFFDKVTVVTTEKYATAVAPRLPENVELWIALENENNVSIRVARRGKINEVKCRAALCGFLSKRELISYLKASSIECSASMSRDSLISLIAQTPVKKLREYVLTTLKSRYQKTFNAFIADAEMNIESLSRSALIRREWAEASTTLFTKNLSSLGRTLDLDRLEKKLGALPSSMPQKIILRKKDSR